jgi:uncharacterized protein (TIGR02246 family)
MIRNLTWFDLAGFIGVLLIVVAYLLLQLDRLPSSSTNYSLLNSAGALLIIISLVFKFNLAAFVVETFWLLISLFGLAKSFTPSRISTLLCIKPEDWPHLFEQRFNAGDLNAVMALYEPDARFVTRSGETLVGHDAIRKALGALIASKTRFQGRVIRATTVGDIAQLYTDFEGTQLDESGKTVPIRNNAIEVLRRQPAGDWKLIMGDPNGRE